MKESVEELKSRQARRAEMQGRATHTQYHPKAWLMAGGKNGDPEYRKSIWPKGKTAKPGRMG